MQGQGQKWKKRSKKSKYRNVKKNGFDSGKEADRYAELKLLQRAGMISDLRTQVRFEIVPGQSWNGHKLRNAVYIADFVYTDQAGNQVVEDVKGYRGGEAYRMFMLKKKLMLMKGIWVNEI